MRLRQEIHQGGRRRKKLIDSDGDVQTMFWHYVRHNLKPSEWYAMMPGERLILRAFMLKEIEQEKEQIKRVERQVKGGN